MLRKSGPLLTSLPVLAERFTDTKVIDAIYSVSDSYF